MRLFIIILGLQLTSISLLAQNRYTIEGIVRNENGEPTVGAKVLLLPTNKFQFTKKDGQFLFEELLPGQYTVQIATIGLPQTNKTVIISNANVQLVVQLDKQEIQIKTIDIQSSNSKRKQENLFAKEIIHQNYINKHFGGSLMQTLSRIPGVSYIGIGSGQSKPLIRGLGFNRVLVLDKGVKHEGQQWGADHGLEIDQFSAGEVEIIKGPASFLYGSDGIGGVINIKPPSYLIEEGVQVNFDLTSKTNNQHFGSSINVNGRKSNWVYGARISYQRYSDYTVPTETVHVYGYPVSLHHQKARNTAGLENNIQTHLGYTNENFKSIFYVSNSFHQSGFFANAHGLMPIRVDKELHDRSDRDIQKPSQEVNHFKVINQSEWELDRHKLSTEISFQRNFRQEFNNYVNHGYMPATYPDRLTIPSDLEREYDKKVYSLNIRDEIRLQKHNLTFGLNADFQDNEIGGWSFLIPAFQQKTIGFFGHNSFQLREKTTIHTAIRYDITNINTREYIDWFASEIEEGKTDFVKRGNHLDKNFNSFVWSLGINQQWNNWYSKLSVGKSFRIPIAKELGANGVNYHYFRYERGNEFLSPEQSYQIDGTLGFNNEKIQIEFTPYYNYFSNYIFLNPTYRFDYLYGAGNQIFEYNQSRVKRFGSELQIKYKFHKNWKLELLGEYLTAKQLSGEKKGFSLPFSPAPSWLNSISWEPTLKKTRLSDFYLSLDFHLTAAQNSIVPPEEKTKGYSLFNIQTGTKINLAKTSVQLRLQVQNVANKKYMNHTSFYRLIQMPEQGRNIILMLSAPIFSK